MAEDFFGGFVVSMGDALGLNLKKKNLPQVFTAIDDDETGKISFRNLKDAKARCGQEWMTDEDLMKMIEYADKDEDGEISLEDFLAACECINGLR